MSLLNAEPVPGGGESDRSSAPTGPGLCEWLAARVTNDPRAVSWFQDPLSEDRIAKAYKELLGGYEQDPSIILKTTRPVIAEHRGVVRIGAINFFSLCAHHFLPFFGTITIEYLPGAQIVGLGKFPRLVQAYSRRFQIQEDLVMEVADEIMSSGGARAVRVTSSARHMCMCSRGPSDHTVFTDATYTLGDIATLDSYAG